MDRAKYNWPTVFYKTTEKLSIDTFSHGRSLLIYICMCVLFRVTVFQLLSHRLLLIFTNALSEIVRTFRFSRESPDHKMSSSRLFICKSHDDYIRLTLYTILRLCRVCIRTIIDTSRDSCDSQSYRLEGRGGSSRRTPPTLHLLCILSISNRLNEPSSQGSNTQGAVLVLYIVTQGLCKRYTQFDQTFSYSYNYNYIFSFFPDAYLSFSFQKTCKYKSSGKDDDLQFEISRFIVISAHQEPESLQSYLSLGTDKDAKLRCPRKFGVL